MDQFVSANGRRGHALMLDCRSLGFQLLPIPQGVSIVVCNTMVKHQIAAGEYNTRRQECMRAVEILRSRLPHITALRDVTMEELQVNVESLDPLLYRRSRHVISENERVQRAAAALRASSLEQFGQLMYASHSSLRDDYEVSCNELDVMVEIASRLPGVIGARMTGGGFGGCTVNLVRNEFVDQFRATIAEQYQARTGMTPSIYVTQASDGASEVNLNS
jgi:galactokinase